MDQELDKLKKHEYYQRNKEKMNLLARERYHKKKVDPDFYKNMLLKNQEAYHKKINTYDRTPEEEEAYFQTIRKHIADLRELDEKYPRTKTIYSYNEMHTLYHD